MTPCGREHVTHDCAEAINITPTPRRDITRVNCRISGCSGLCRIERGAHSWRISMPSAQKVHDANHPAVRINGPRILHLCPSCYTCALRLPTASSVTLRHIEHYYKSLSKIILLKVSCAGGRQHFVYVSMRAP